MNPNTNTNTSHRPNRWARLKKQLTRARADRDTLKRKFEIEKNAKNEAYSFILSFGLLEEFAEYHRAAANIDPMLICSEAIKQRHYNECTDEGNATDRPE